MRIWLIIQGEKQGPFPIHDIISRIRLGELDATIHAWHDGMLAWKPLGEIESFRHEFESPQVDEESPPPLPHPMKQVAMTPMPPTQLWRRWAARMFDMVIWQSICFGFCAAVGWPLKEWILSGGFVVIAMPLWIPIEAFMLHWLSHTPGKYLLGLRITNHDGSRLNVKTAMIRSMRCFFMGMGAFYPIVMPFCQAFCWWFSRRHGIALWDLPQKLQVVHRPLAWWRWCVMLLLCLVISNMLASPAVPVMKEVLQIQMPNHPLLRYMEP